MLLKCPASTVSLSRVPADISSGKRERALTTEFSETVEESKCCSFVGSLSDPIKIIFCV